MNKNARSLILMSLLAASLILTAAAQQKADTAIDPVCGMTVVKANAKATFEYKGTTYYFCNPGCKDAFAKDPEKYLKKQAEAKDAAGAPAAPMMQHKTAQGEALEKMPMGQAGCPMMGGAGMGGGMMMHRRMMMGGRMGMMGRGMMAGGMSMPLMREDVDVVVENTANGATLKITSKDPETVKLIQEHLARMKEMRETMKKEAADQAACCANCPMKKK